MTTSDRFRRAAICQWVFAPAVRIEQITLALKPNVRWSEKHLDEKRSLLTFAGHRGLWRPTEANPRMEEPAP
jgi:hypothetical protein